MSPCQRQFVHPEISNNRQVTIHRSATRSGRERLPAAPKGGLKYELNFKNLGKGSLGLGCTIGKGSGVRGEEGQGVDIRISSACKTGVGNVQAAVVLHPHSGVLMVAGMDNDIPVVYHANGERIKLHAGESHVLVGRCNLLEFGDLMFVLEIPTYDPSSDQANYRVYTAERNEALRKVGLLPPNEKLLSLPRKNHIELFGDVIAYNSITEGAFGTILAGINRYTGEPVAVKVMNISERRTLKEMTPELEVSCGLIVSLSPHLYLYKDLPRTDPRQDDTQGLLQASGLLCDKGCVLDLVELKYKEDLEFCEHKFARLHLIMPLASKDLDQVEWERVDKEYKARVAIALLTAVSVLHEGGRVHRDISPQNILILSEKPVKAVLADFGKVTQDGLLNSVNIGPPLLHAPEVGCTNYSNKIDSWNTGLVLCRMLVPDEYEKNISSLQSPSKEPFCQLMRDALEVMGQRSQTESELSRITIGLIIINPEERWSVHYALNNLATFMHDDYAD